jgi:hypothetical protein
MTLPALARRVEQKGRMYVRPSTQGQAPSVTNITGKKDKSGPLVGWACKHAGLKHEAILAEIVETLRTEDPEIAKKLLLKEFGTKTARSASARAVKGARFEDKVTEHFSAAVAGTLVHDAIEYRVHNGRFGFGYGARQDIAKAGTDDVTALKEIDGWLRQYLAFEARFKPEWLLLEATVWNETLGYAGTMDGLMRLPNGRKYLVDFKTGNGVYPEYGMQVEALARGEIIIDPETGDETPMTEVDALAILHIRPQFSDLHEVRRHEQVWKAFLGLIEVSKFEDMAHLVLGTSVRTEAEEEALAA